MSTAIPIPSLEQTTAARPLFGPTRSGERLLALDVLRGFALFGVLLSNLDDWYGTPTATTATDRVFGWAQGWLWENRFYSLLAFLFGVGFALQLIRAEERGIDVRPTFYRRMLALLFFGVAHGMLIWDGDILTAYALVGCMLVLFRRLSVRGLLISAVAVQIGVRYALVMLLRAFHLRMVPASGPPGTADFVFSHGSFTSILSTRVQLYLDHLGRFPVGTFPTFLAMMILGLAIVRSGFLRNLPERLPVIRKALWISLACVALAGYISLHAGAWWKPLTHYPESIQDAGFWSPRSALIRLPRWFFVWGMSASAACVLTIFAVRRPNAALNRWLSAVGRMTLTTYLVQSIICTLLFYNYGFGLYGRVGYAGMFLLTLFIYALQVAASTWWLKRFEFGPAEWLWRVLTYGRSVPIRRRELRAT